MPYSSTNTILLVCDDPEEQDRVAELCSASPEEKENVFVVESIADALASLRDQLYNVVLLVEKDEQRTSGLIKIRTQTPQVPVILIGDRTDEVASADAVEAGAQDYLLRETLESGLLRRAIRYAIERHRLMIELQMRRQMELVNSEDRFRNIIEENADAILVIGEGDTIQFMNAAAEELFKHAPDVALGGPFGYPLSSSGNITIPGAQGASIFVEINVADSEWEDQPVRLASLRDVTERHTAYERLRLSESRFRSLFDGSPDAIIVATDDGEILDGNAAAESLFALPIKDLKGTFIQSFLINAPGLRKLKTLDDVLTQKRSLVQLVISKEDGTDLPVELRANRIDFENTKAFLMHVRDETQRREFEAALITAKNKAEELARVKSAFLANMSHEIRTPLTSILGFAAVLGEEIEEEKHRRFLTLIERSGNRLMDTISSVLSLAKLEAGKVRLRPETLDLAQKIEDVVHIMEPQAEAKGLRLFANLPEEEVFMVLDETSLDRVLYNLTGNAIKFTNEGQVELKLEKEEGGIRLSVIDTGIGISDAFLPELFEEFQQGSVGLTRMHEGSGLGLAITRRLVDLMNGQIDVRSKDGEGSTFTVFFRHPLAAPKHDRPPVVRSKTAPS